MIRVLVVDDHPLFRDGLVALLRTVDDIEVIGSVGSGEDAVRDAASLAPDLVVMDLNLPGISGMEATRRILARDPQARILVLTMVDDDDTITAALRVGARGYLLKGAGQEEVLAALRTVAAGGGVVGAGAAARMFGAPTRYGVDLTPREAEVLALIGEGSDNAEIAQQLGVSVKTVQNHVSHVLQKMQVADRTKAAFRARGL